jgi:hypothetical protein
VILPGLRHFYRRFAPGRLYDVPVKLGWRDRPLTEEELNPLAPPDLRIICGLPKQSEYDGPGPQFFPRDFHLMSRSKLTRAERSSRVFMATRSVWGSSVRMLWIVRRSCASVCRSARLRLTAGTWKFIYWSGVWPHTGF